MKTVTIELVDGYFIEVDELNHTLKQRYQGETKDGEKSLRRESSDIIPVSERAWNAL